MFRYLEHFDSQEVRHAMKLHSWELWWRGMHCGGYTRRTQDKIILWSFGLWQRVVS